MSQKIVYDLIQRFEVEGGLPRLISTTIQVLEGGEDLMSLAIQFLHELNFYEKFEEVRTSQYIGYRLKKNTRGTKRYWLILSQRKDSLYISMPKSVLEDKLLEIEYYSFVDSLSDNDHDFIRLGLFWVLPSKKDVFRKTIKYKEIKLRENLTGSFCFAEDDQDFLSEYPPHFRKDNLASQESYLIFEQDKLFPYTFQTYINSPEILKEFIQYFGEILIEG